MELLQFAYFSRQKEGVIGVDVVEEMLQASKNNFIEAEKLNPWFKSEFVKLLKGDALHLPIDDKSIDVAAQNCLFNIFKHEELKLALKEMYRVLKPGGHIVLVIANNTIAGRTFRTPAYMARIAAACGLTVTACFIDAIRSRGLMTKRNHTASMITREWIFLFTKGDVLSGVRS